MTDTFAVIGEALIDVVVRPDGSTAGEYPGGSPANVAVGLARLGHDTELVTRLGRDAYGDLVADHLTGNGVRLAPGTRDDAPTSTATARLGADGAATYTFRLTWDLPDLAVPGGTVCAHAGSIAAFLPPGAARVRTLLDAAAPYATISYDPNCRPDLQGTPDRARPQVESLVGRADVVRASTDDLAWLYPGRDPVDVARQWLGLGPGLIVVTYGADGAHGVTADADLHIPAPPSTAVDTVGAGDSFTSALLSGMSDTGLLGGRVPPLGADALTGLLEHAARAAAITVSRRGADPPTRAELEAWP